MLTELQKTEREASIGSSDAPIVLGVSPYQSPIELYWKLRGDLPRYSPEESQAQRIGSKLEPVIAEMAAEDLGIKIRRCPTKRHARYPFMVANLDYEIIGNSRGPGVFEIKNRSGGKPYTELPADIDIQVRHQMAVTNRNWAIVAVLFEFCILRTYEVFRSEQTEYDLIQAEAKFMDCVLEGIVPPHEWTPDSLDVLKQLYPTSTAKAVTLGEGHAVNVEGYLKAKAQLDQAETIKAIYEGALKEAMGDAEAAIVPGYRLSWKSTKGSIKFDMDRFKQEQPELVKQYTIQAPGYRRFIVKEEKPA